MLIPKRFSQVFSRETAPVSDVDGGGRCMGVFPAVQAHVCVCVG